MMKKIFGFLFSSRLMAILIAVFAVSIATATFIENSYGSQTAYSSVYNSFWFELLLFLGIINLSGTILQKRLYLPKKLSIFIFHFAFLLILIGAAVTRYFGFEGFMHIREGETSDIMISDNVYLCTTVSADHVTAYSEKKIYFSQLSDNYRKLQLKILDKKVLVELIQYFPNASQTIVEDKNGKPVIELVIAGNTGKHTIVLSDHQTKIIDNLTFSFNDNSNKTGVNIIYMKDELKFSSAVTTLETNMVNQSQNLLQINQYYPFQLRTLYNFGGVQVVAKNFYYSGKVDIASSNDKQNDENAQAVLIRVSSHPLSDSFYYFLEKSAINKPVEVRLNDILVSVMVGAKEVHLPFSLKLNKFILEHYPGSNSPSWFESKILLKDDEDKINEEKRIYMNNVLNYKGFRFYQSSYDIDEKGTILSVNHDYWGTFITYLGYLLLGLGIILSILNKNSRFRTLSKNLAALREQRKIMKVGVVIFIATLTGSISTFAQNNIPDSIKIENQHAEKFGKLLIQDPGGRIKPINSLSSELFRKISRATQVMGQTSDQVLLGMLVYPNYWQKVPMIKVTDPEIREILRTKNNYISFIDVFDFSSPQQNYLLGKYVDIAYQKKPAYRKKFDTELIRIDERINLCYLIYSGEIFKIFPKPNDLKKKWCTPMEIGSVFKGKDSGIVTSMIPLYFRAIRDGAQSGNWKNADEILVLLKTYQNKFGGEIIPPDFKIKLEILYNRLNIFDRLGSIYGLIGFILLIFQFISVFLPKVNLKWIIRFSGAFVVLCFILHIAGLIVRWYISGHAPWSNAYESLIYIAFATVLAGLIFSRKSGFTLSVAALLAWLILFVAHLNWMDPEITNLVPVLKSYWLLIHVAIITASYGFLAMGALLAFINLIMMISKTEKNLITTENIISELSIIIEMTLIIGLYMLAIGTFLGGVWANESWGKYWGWDPKETWALVSVMVYAFVAHMRMVPGLKGNYIFNLMALLSFGSIIMTYFGVNYYLSGLHSYAKGDPAPVPVFVYYTIAVITIVAIIAWSNNRKFNKSLK